MFIKTIDGYIKPEFATKYEIIYLLSPAKLIPDKTQKQYPPFGLYAYFSDNRSVAIQYGTREECEETLEKIMQQIDYNVSIKKDLDKYWKIRKIMHEISEVEFNYPESTVKIKKDKIEDLLKKLYTICFSPELLTCNLIIED